MLYTTAVHNRDDMNSHGHLNMLCDNVYGDQLKGVLDQLPSHSRLSGLASGFTWIKPGTMFGKKLNVGFSNTSSSLNGKLHGNSMDKSLINDIVDNMHRGGTSNKKINEYLKNIDRKISSLMSGPYVTSVLKGLNRVCNGTHPQLEDNEAIKNGANTRREKFAVNELTRP